MRALWRILVLIPLGFVLACFAAGGFLVLAVIGVDGENFTAYGAETLMLVFATTIPLLMLVDKNFLPNDDE